MQKGFVAYPCVLLQAAKTRTIATQHNRVQLFVLSYLTCCQSIAAPLFATSNNDDTMARHILLLFWLTCARLCTWLNCGTMDGCYCFSKSSTTLVLLFFIEKKLNFQGFFCGAEHFFCPKSAIIKLKSSCCIFCMFFVFCVT